MNKKNVVYNKQNIWFSHRCVHMRCDNSNDIDIDFFFTIIQRVLIWEKQKKTDTFCLFQWKYTYRFRNSFSLYLFLFFFICCCCSKKYTQKKMKQNCNTNTLLSDYYYCLYFCFIGESISSARGTQRKNEREKKNGHMVCKRYAL